MNLPREYQEGRFVILPISYEKDLTFGEGTSKGAVAIIEASKHLEYYDCRFDVEAFEDGISVMDELSLCEKSPEEMVSVVSETVANKKDKFIISLGGDHAVTIGIVKGLEQNHEFSIIQFDAHADFRDSWNGSSLNHACVSRQISKKHSLLNIGVRSMDIDEKRLMEQEENVHVIKAYEFDIEKVKEILPKLKEKIYITIDVDAFDPSFIRNTGTPEPGGLTWNHVIATLERIFKTKTVIGADIVEFAPKHDYEGEAYALAKLAYVMLGLSKKFNK
ncbi:TPA: agmatinase [Candidatus Woesearchaeota archaeon]|nr:agmatinase [Candidatus Woesearchaeota archaeon]